MEILAVKLLIFRPLKFQSLNAGLLCLYVLETRRNHGFNRVNRNKIGRQLAEILNFYHIRNANVFSAQLSPVNFR